MAAGVLTVWNPDRLSAATSHVAVDPGKSWIDRFAKLTERAHEYSVSIVHVGLQPSPASRLLSSQSSVGATMPSGAPPRQTAPATLTEATSDTSSRVERVNIGATVPKATPAV